MKKLVAKNQIKVLILLLILIFPLNALAASYSADNLVGLTNNERAKNGKGALTVNSMLVTAANAKAQDMFAKNYFSHTSPTGKTPWDFIREAGYVYQYAGENLAIGYSNASELMNAWLNSPTHRENILSDNYREIGMAVVEGQYNGVNTIIVVQEFGSQMSAGIQGPNGSSTPMPGNAGSPSPSLISIQFNSDKSLITPSSIFEGEEAEIKVAVTGDVSELTASVGNEKINLLGKGSIVSDGVYKIYSSKVKGNTAGKYNVEINATDSKQNLETFILGSLEIKPKVVSSADRNDNHKSFIAGLKDMIARNWVIVVATFFVIAIAIFIFIIFKKKSFQKMPRPGFTLWNL